MPYTRHMEAMINALLKKQASCLGESVLYIENLKI